MQFSIAAIAAIATIAAATLPVANGTLADSPSVARVGINGTNPYDNYVTVYVTNCPVTSTDAAGATVTTHIKSTVTSTVCPKCTKTAEPKPSAIQSTPAKGNGTETGPKSVQNPKTNNNGTVTPTRAPLQQPKANIPKQANGASKAVVGAAALALPVVVALM
ncbi:Hypothetical protein conserved in the Yarrowia clade [Yarrowia lipolytica]|nr:Hypothetical protein conserved in the Yarrowia clade [Yarrowia lipolytica]